MMDEKKIINNEIEDIEIKLLLEAIFLRYGYDFRKYSQAHMKRRILRRLSMSDIASITDMQYRVLHDKTFFESILGDFSINVTEMFRDPSFYKAFRKDVIPELKTYPFLRIWHAGCATGEEVYSMAILLKEEGLYDRTQIYATDFNETVLHKAKEGIYSIDTIRDYTMNYQQSGGMGSFADYYIAKYDSVIIDKSLKEKIIFADHNLVTDGVFGEMNVVICRNVLIYFNKELQDKVIGLFYDSLCNRGFMCLGSKESIKFTSLCDKFEPYVEKERIFRRKFSV